MPQRKINKVAKALKKASNTHAKQAKALEAIKLKSGGSASDVPDNVANPSLYRKAKAKAKAKFDVFPSAYASSYIVSQYKEMGGKYKGAKKAEGGAMNKNFDAKKSDLNKDGRISKYERKRGEAIAKSMAQRKSTGGSVYMEPRGCGAMMQSKRKQVRVPRG